MAIAVIGGWIFNRAAAWVLLKLRLFASILGGSITIGKAIITSSKLQHFSSSCLKSFTLCLVKGLIGSVLIKKTVNSSYAIQKCNSEPALNLNRVYRHKGISIPQLNSKVTGLSE